MTWHWNDEKSIIAPIKKVAIFGSGVMGSAIAAQIACSGRLVLLYDNQDDKGRNISQIAIESMLGRNQLTHKKYLTNISSCNSNDDLEKLNDVDLVIEAIIEDVEIKKSLYKKIIKYITPGTVIASNTSTISLGQLNQDMPKEWQKDFMVNHFFNPPKYVPLLEMIVNEHMDHGKLEKLQHFYSRDLGKNLILCKDTPGFIGNRIGFFYIMAGIDEAIKSGISISEADYILGHKLLGIPKTGLFGLIDLIGIDVVQLIIQSLVNNLPPTDEIHLLEKTSINLIEKLVKAGHLGRKSNEGFYFLEKKSDGTKIMRSLDIFNTKELSYEINENSDQNKKFTDIGELLLSDDKLSKFAFNTIGRTILYAGSLVGKISDNILQIEEAMMYGYGWQFGLFGIINKILDKNSEQWKLLIKKFKNLNKNLPNTINHMDPNKGFYRKLSTSTEFVSHEEKEYQTIDNKNCVTFEQIKIKNKPILHNDYANLWLIDDKVLCFEHTTKMGIFNIDILDLMDKAVNLLNDNAQYIAMIITNDQKNFSAGADINMFVNHIKARQFDAISKIVRNGQSLFNKIKHSEKPVVLAASGFALGGAFELILHSSKVFVHIDINAGPVEIKIGIIPGWGGTKELIIKDSVATEKVMENIISASTTKSAEYLYDMIPSNKVNGYGNQRIQIVHNRTMLFSSALQWIYDYAESYTPIKQEEVLIVNKCHDNFRDLMQKLNQKYNFTPYDMVIAKKLYDMIDSISNNDLTEQHLLNAEHDLFMDLIKDQKTLDRMEYMIKNGKKLEN